MSEIIDEHFYIDCQGTYKSPRDLQGTYPKYKCIIDNYSKNVHQYRLETRP